MISISLFKSYFELNYLQQNHYHFKFRFNLIYLINILPLFYYFNILKIPSISLFIILTLIEIILILRNKLIIKLKFSSRIRRILLLYLVLILCLVIFKLYFFIPFLNIFLLYFSFFSLKPLELLIQRKFVLKAQRKIKEINPLIIGITGSAGKTTTKNICYELLKDHFITFKTRASYNTINGLSRSINEDLEYGCEVCILEYGVSHRFDMSKSLKLVKPHISIITNIHKQHLETFKTIENIKKEKTKIIEGNLIHIKNIESNYEVSNKVYVVSVGFTNKAEHYASDIVYCCDGMQFIYHNNGTSIELKTKLLGKNNVLNILFGLALLKYLKPNVNIEQIKSSVSNLNQIKSRLELKYVNDITIINDSFNSNIDGFKEAINILKAYNKPKLIITPGLVSGNLESDNLEISKLLAESNNQVYLIKSIVSDYYEKSFKDLNYKSYQVFNSFMEAYSKAINENFKVILIENDITDIYKKKGKLK